MSRVLLIGGPGDISGGCAEELIAGGHPLAILKRTENADPRFADTVQFYRGDRSRPADLKAALDDFRPDAVVDFVCFEPERVEELAALLPDTAHYVFVSTVDTYGYPLSHIARSCRACAGRWRIDGDCYKWLEAMAHVYGATCDPELDRQMDEVIG